VGVQTDYDGTCFEGNWEYNIREGEGTETYPDGAKYIGTFIEGKKAGNG